MVSRNSDNGRIIVKYAIPAKTILDPTGKNRYYKVFFGFYENFY